MASSNGKRPGFEVSEVRLTAAPETLSSEGMLGWVEFVLDRRFKVSDVSLRKTLDGRLALSFPARKDRTGGNHFCIRPINDETRREVERQVFEALSLAARGTRG